MPTVQLDGQKIIDRAAFHEACKAVFGFPDFYGCNMDAWIDCLSTLREDDGMTKFKLGPEETLKIEVLHSNVLRREAPDIFGTLKECTSIVNEECIENGEEPSMALVFL